jgi:hypothetical protein
MKRRGKKGQKHRNKVTKGVEVQKRDDRWNKREKCRRKEILNTAQVRKTPPVGIEFP